MDLVIVESPTKARTLARFLGKKFRIEATLGHLRDLPKNELGVDLKNDFQPKYVVVPGRQKRIRELKSFSREAEKLILATDLDREGEAIAWHVLELIQIPNPKSQIPILRVVFHEITPGAIKEAFSHPRALDQNLVNAQQARRVLDRLVGYQLSPLIWEKVRYGLSAGRVQSVAVRLVVEREREREAFVPQESWDIIATLDREGKAKTTFEARLVKIGQKPAQIATEKEARAVTDKLEEAIWQIKAVAKTDRFRSPYPPLTTASLQRAASGLFGFSAKKTMALAQSLYEQGLITYHRTDSTSLAETAVSAIRKLIKKEFGQAYLPEKRQAYRTKVKVAQEAHEAIRPTKIELAKPIIGGRFGADAGRLYGLIWRQTLACQMAKAVYEQTKVEIEAKHRQEVYLFRAVASLLKFDGWLRIAGSPGPESENKDLVEETTKALPLLEVGQLLKLLNLRPEQHFTQPPPRYTEAGLIKALEERGIGRPSTYAPIITTIQDRDYVVKENKSLAPTPTGEVVNDLLVKHFPKIVDYDFTAELEEELDEIARGEEEWVKVIRNFYQPFAKNLEAKAKEIKKEEIVVRRRLDETCPKCQGGLVVKLGRFGEFVSCADFPRCDYARPVEKLVPPDPNSESGIKKEGKLGSGEINDTQLAGPCPKCGGKLVLKEGRYGKFIACSNYPTCKYTRTYQDGLGTKCPTCNEGEVIRKKTRRGKMFYGCSRYPDCDWASWEKPELESDNQP